MPIKSRVPSGTALRAMSGFRWASVPTVSIAFALSLVLLSSIMGAIPRSRCSRLPVTRNLLRLDNSVASSRASSLKFGDLAWRSKKID